MPSLSRSPAYGHVQSMARKTRAQTTTPTPEARKCERQILSLNSTSSPSGKSSQKEQIHLPTYSPDLSREKMLHTRDLEIETTHIYCQELHSVIFQPNLNKHNSLKKIKSITYFSCSHGADVKEILLSSKNDKVSERQSFPISIHSRNSY